MLLILAAVVGGVLVGLALGGSLTTLSNVRFRWWPLALLGLALQLAPVPHRGSLHTQHVAAVGLLIGSYVVLLTFVALNFRLPGFSLIAAGFALNLLVISVNGGMPVNQRALEIAGGPRYVATVTDLLEHGGAKHHLARGDDVLLGLSDVIPVSWPTRNVFSVGDLIAMLGIAWVLAAATKGPAGRHRLRPGATRQGSDAADRPEAVAGSRSAEAGRPSTAPSQGAWRSVQARK